MLGDDGLATAPADAPPQVQAIIAAGNKIASKPYKYGGGHGKWEDSGYDCSGSLSYAFHGAGMLDEALDSTGFMSWGEAGKGQWVTIYAKGSHAYMVIAGLRFDTSGRSTQNTRWQTDMRSSLGLHGPSPRRSLDRGQGKGGTACAVGGPGVQLAYLMAARLRCSSSPRTSRCRARERRAGPSSRRCAARRPTSGRAR